jgi:hypothetical protein
MQIIIKLIVHLIQANNHHSQDILAENLKANRELKMRNRKMKLKEGFLEK